MKHTKSLFAIAIFLIFGSSVFAADYYQNTQGYETDYNISRGKGVVVAIISTGVWFDHPELKGTNWVNSKEIENNKKDDDKNGFIDDYYGWNFVDKNSKLSPKTNLGTNMAGIIAGKAENYIGIAGIAPEAKIMPIIACDSKECPKQAIIDSINYATDNGADIIVFGIVTNGSVAYSSDYDKAIKKAYDKGVLIIAPAGNGDTKSAKQVGKNLDKSKASPVCNDSSEVNMVLGVGATQKSSFMKTNWTNYGDKYVDVFVSGKDLITTTVPSLSKKLEYDTVSGTVFSASIVAGVGALYINKYPESKIYEVISRLKNTNPFYINNLFNNTVYTSFCSINYFDVGIIDGEMIELSASNLRPNISLDLKNAITDAAINIPAKNITIVDYNKLRIDTSKLSIPAGLYYVKSDVCIVEGKILIKEKKKEVVKVCDLKNLRNCNRTQIIELITNLIRKK